MFNSFADSLRAKNQGKLPFEDALKSIKTRFNRIFVENKNMGPDMLFMMTYMAAITTAQATRPEIFSYTAARQEYVPARYVKKVEFFVKRWGYSYVEALIMVAEKTENEILQSMLNRYANSIDSGVPDEDFLTRELETIKSVYRNTYEQGLELLKKWGDAYVAMLFSSALVGIIIMVSIAIFAPDNVQSTLATTYYIIIGISVFGLVTMYRSVPADDKTHSLPTGSREQNMVHRLEKRIVPLAIGVMIMILVLGMVFTPNWMDFFGLALLLFGLLLFPLGLIGYLDDQNIVKRDAEFPTFIRSLGAVMGGKGVTTTHALKDIDRKSLIALEPLISSVYSKLNLGLDEKRSWDRFLSESGSNLITKYLNIFRDACELGGKPDAVGSIIGSSMLEQTLLMERRNTVGMGFIVLLVPMHAMMVAILLFLFHILIKMGSAIKQVMETLPQAGSAISQPGSIGGTMGGGLQMFVNFPVGDVTMYIIIVIVLLTVSNTLAGKIVMGGDRYLYYFFASLLCTVSGIIYIIAPFMVGLFFNIPTFKGI